MLICLHDWLSNKSQDWQYAIIGRAATSMGSRFVLSLFGLQTVLLPIQESVGRLLAGIHFLVQ